MPLTFKDFYSEILGTIPKIPIPIAKRLINRAWRDVQDAHQWSFLQQEGVLFSPGVITSGTVSVTQFSNSITFDATARAALQVTNPVMTKRQFRVAGGGEIYNFISTVNAGTGIATLDRPFIETTNSASGYLVYRCYYGPPQLGTSGTEVTDFLRYNTIYNPAISDYFRGVQLSRDLLNKMDPQRSNVGNNPYYLFTYKGSSDGTPQFEMWPHPTASQAYLCSYQRRGVELSGATDVLPLVIPDDLILERALYLGCLWAEKNKARYTELKGINWMIIGKEHNKTYSNIDARNPGLLEIACRQDEEAFPQSIIIDDRTFANFAVGDDDKTGFYNINPG